MNKQRRKDLEGILEALRENTLGLTQSKEEEEEAYDNLPEGLKESEKGEKMYENQDNLESAISSLEEACEYIEQAIQ